MRNFKVTKFFKLNVVIENNAEGRQTSARLHGPEKIRLGPGPVTQGWSQEKILREAKEGGGG